MRASIEPWPNRTMADFGSVTKTAVFGVAVPEYNI